MDGDGADCSDRRPAEYAAGVVRPMSMPSRSASNSERWVWLAPWYLVLAKRTTSAITASGVALTGLRPRWPCARAAAPSSR